MKILITTVPFSQNDQTPLRLLNRNNIQYLINPVGRKLKEDELAGLVGDFDVIIAGTENISEYVMQKASNLKMISRVGVGLDGIDLVAAKRKGIHISYTPDAPAPAVAELAIGLMISLVRSVHVSNLQMHNGSWHRYFGKRLSECFIGIIGVGRIGQKVIDHLLAFNCKGVMVNDIRENSNLYGSSSVTWHTKEEIYRHADLISLHVPLNKSTRNMVGRRELETIKPDGVIINTARGGILNEEDLYQVMKGGHLRGAAIDVFRTEPYQGKLSNIERCILTAHMGSMSEDCRSRMEIEATEEAIRFLTKKPLINTVPDEEYELQRSYL